MSEQKQDNSVLPSARPISQTRHYQHLDNPFQLQENTLSHANGADDLAEVEASFLALWNAGLRVVESINRALSPGKSG